jgi:hypothetical protein
VIVVDSKTIELGNVFDAAKVDTKSNTITFDQGYSFKDGDKVVYQASNGTAIGGLVSGKTYVVKVVDTHTIQLQDPANIAPDVNEGARLSDFTTVSGATTISAKVSDKVNNTFANGDMVVYKERSASFTVGDTIPDTSGQPNIFNLDTASGDLLSKDTINSASHGFETGDQVIYTSSGTALGGLTNGGTYYVIKVDDNHFQLSATLGGSAIHFTSATNSTSHKITAVGLNATTTTTFDGSSINANQIHVSQHGFTTGQAVVYKAPVITTPVSGSSVGSTTTPVGGSAVGSTTTPVGGLIDGATYYVIKVDDNDFELAATAADAQNNIAINLTATTGLQSLQVTAALQEGVDYYVTNATSTGFQLTDKPGGNAITIDTTGLTGTGADHIFVKQSVVDLTSAGTGTQNLHIHLDNTTATGTKHTLSSGASIVLPSQGDQVFSAYSQASSGAVIAGGGAQTSIQIASTMNTYVGSGASITTTGNVTVSGQSGIAITGAASTNTGGIVAIGIGQLDAGIVNNNTTTVSDNAKINAAGYVTIDGQSGNNFNVSSDSTAGGLIPAGKATSTVNVTHNTTTTIGNQVNITSQRDLLVHSSSNTAGNVKASASGGGFIPFAYGTANLNVNGVNETDVNAATLSARKLTVESAVDNISVGALGLGQAGGLIGIIQAKSNINLNNTRATTNIGSGASLKADELDINAVFTNVNTNSTALGHCDGLGGKTDSDATDNMNLSATVNTDANSTLTVDSLNVKSGFDTFNNTNYAYSKKAWELRIWTPFGDIVITLDFGRANSDNKSFNAQSFTNFNSNVVRLARQVNPLLIIDTNGNVSLKSDNVTVTNNGTDINVGNISATGGGKITFSSGAASTGGSFSDKGKYSATNPAFDSVEIQNYSNENLIINGIDTISSGSSSPSIDYSNVKVSQNNNPTIISSGSLPANPTLVTINNWGNSNLILQGVINNPHDRTILYSNGNIFSQGSNQEIITRDLTITAKNGSIGTNNQRIVAQLDQGYTPVTSDVPSSDIYLAAEALNSDYLQLTAKGLNNNPVKVNVKRMTASTGEVNLTIGQTTNQTNTPISALYNFSDLYDTSQQIVAGTGIVINAGATTTNLNGKIGFFGTSAGSLSLVTGGSINVTNLAGQVNVKQAISAQDSVTLTSGTDVALVDNAVVQAANGVTLTAADLTMSNNATVKAAKDVNLSVQHNFQINSTATITAGNNVTIKGDYNNQDTTGSSITLDGWIYAQALSIYGDTHQDTFNIRRLATATNLYTSGGNDIVNIGSSQPGFNGTNDIRKRLSVYGGTQPNNVDTLNVDDSGDTSNTVGVLTDKSLTGLGMGEGIYYNGFKSLNVKLGKGNNNFTILNTSATTNIDGSAGTDTFRIGPKVDANGNVMDEVVDGVLTSGTNILGTSNITNIKTGQGNNYVQVNRNTGVLNIQSQSGNNTFEVNTPINHSVLLANAQVNLSGGSSNDTAIINGSSLLEPIQNKGSSVQVTNSRLISLIGIENLIIHGNQVGTSSSGSSTTGSSGSNSSNPSLSTLASRTLINSSGSSTNIPSSSNLTSSSLANRTLIK